MRESICFLLRVKEGQYDYFEYIFAKRFFFIESERRFVLGLLWAFSQYIICYEMLQNRPRKNWPIGYTKNDHFLDKLTTNFFFGNWISDSFPPQ